MKYEITITPAEKENNDITLSLNTANGEATIRSYGTTMTYAEFVDFADAVQELRQKFTVINAKSEENNEPTGDGDTEADQRV